MESEGKFPEDCFENKEVEEEKEEEESTCCCLLSPNLSTSTAAATAATVTMLEPDVKLLPEGLKSG